MRALLYNEMFADTISVALVGDPYDTFRKQYVYAEPEVRVVQDGEAYVPSLRFRRDELQAIVDACAAFGINPTTPQAPASELAAVRYHLEDFRRLVFKK